jgi:hypothetical protein
MWYLLTMPAACSRVSLDFEQKKIENGRAKRVLGRTTFHMTCQSVSQGNREAVETEILCVRGRGRAAQMSKSNGIDADI